MSGAKRKITYIHVSANRDSLGRIPIASKSNVARIVSAPAISNVSGDEKELNNVMFINVYYFLVMNARTRVPSNHVWQTRGVW